MAAFEYSSTTDCVSDGRKDLSAAWKWISSHTKRSDLRLSLKAAIPASLHRPSRSAPVKSSVRSATFQRSTSSPNGCVVFHIDLPHLVVEHTKPAVKMKKKNMIIVCYVWGRGSGRSGYHIKTPWAQKSSINCIWAISSSQYNNSLHQKLQDTFLVQRKGIYEIWQGESFECHRQTKYVRGTVASSKPSISVNRVDKSLSPTVALPLEFPLGPVLNDYKLQY